jgi:predicted glycosyltransferase
LIDISHPAHVHFFKHAIQIFREHGHFVVVASRHKDITTRLLDLERIQHYPLSVAPQRKNLIAFAIEMLSHCGNLYKIGKFFKPDVMLQVAGTFVAPVGCLLRCPTVVFYDTEFAKISNTISYPLASYVCTPDCYERRIRGRHIRYPGYHELSYLHPDVFTANEAVLKDNNLVSNEKYFIVRFVGWAALHDYQEKGFDLKHKLKLVNMLLKYGKVLISSESPLPDQLKKYQSTVPVDKIHDVMAYSSLVIGESATMASEAAVLGVPAIFISTTSRGYTNEQECRYGLVNTFNPNQQRECLKRVEDIASQTLEQIRIEFQKRRNQLLTDKKNTSEWMVEFVESNFL